VSIWSGHLSVRGPQDLEDLATADWLAETLFAALELGVFEALAAGDAPADEVAERVGAEPQAFRRLTEALEALGLLSLHDGRVACTTVARRYLLPGEEAYLGHSLRYRRQLAANWSRLADAVRSGGSPMAPAPDESDDYRARVRRYLLAMDDVARHKARRITERVHLDRLPARTDGRERFVLDLGGGGGGVAAELVRQSPGWRGVVVDMPEVVEVAQQAWAERGSASQLSFVGLDLLSEALPAPPDGSRDWDVIVLSNIVHAFAEAESGGLLHAAAAAVAPGGLIIVHDFWTDGRGRGPAKAALFDLHMLVNTYQGRTYPWAWAQDRLAGHGLAVVAPVSLGEGQADEDTRLVVAARDPGALAAVDVDSLDRLESAALELGLARTARLDPAAVVTAAWVREKCRFGCSGYGESAHCPPRSPAPHETRDLLRDYSCALLVQGEPPTASFHRQMLALERAAFLQGHTRALAFAAGPCRLCAECTPDACSRPAEARPSMEAAGMDVYRTAEAVGWRLEPVPDRESPVTYLGLLLVG
jgi:predicted metal-binding protein/predicted O-methyltransferase YrrM